MIQFDSGCRVQGAGLRVQGPGSRVQGPGLRVYGRGAILSYIRYQAGTEFDRVWV